MTFLPIVDRELRLASRRGRTYWMRLGAATVAGVTALGILSPSFRGLQSPAASGTNLFLALAIGGFGLCLLAGTFITADCLSEEKRESTLGLLLLTNLKSHDIVLGKLVATSLNPFYGLIAAMPVLALPLMLGGVTAGEFWRMALVLTNTLFFSLAAGMFVSALSYNGHKAVAATLLVIFLMAVAPAVSLAFTGGPAHAVLILSPGYACFLAFQAKFATAPNWFWFSILCTHFTAWLLLILAAWLLPKFSQDRPVKQVARWKNKFLLSRRSLEEWEGEREKLLSGNPVLWLARRERFRYVMFWGFIGFFALGWLVGLWQFGPSWLRPEIVFATTSTLHLVIKCWIALEASRRFAEGRRSGELELLLVTPLSVEDILTGRMLALKRQFFVPIAVVIAVDIWLFLFCLSSPGWLGSSQMWAVVLLAGCGMFLVDSYTMTWVGLWQGLAAKNPTNAFVHTLGQVLLMPWIIYLVSLAVIAPLLGAGEWVVIWWLFVGIGNCFGLCTWANSQLQDEFREAATQVSKLKRPRLILEQLFPREGVQVAQG